jgi:hypothetical protein
MSTQLNGLANSKFKRGSAAFKCIHCARLTRDTNGDNGRAKMCEDCYEGSMQENGYMNSEDAERDQYKASMRACYQAAVNKGGVIDGYTKQ